MTTPRHKDRTDTMGAWTRFDDLLSALNQARTVLILFIVLICFIAAMFFAGLLWTMYPTASCAALQRVALCK